MAQRDGDGIGRIVRPGDDELRLLVVGEEDREMGDILRLAEDSGAIRSTSMTPEVWSK